MPHHNTRDCTIWPCNPTPTPSASHHPPAADPDEDDGTTSEAHAEVQVPLRREDDSQ